MINYSMKTDVDTRDGSKIYVLKITEKLNTNEYRKKATEIYSIGGYYSKFKHGFIFREQPSFDEIETALNGKIPRMSEGVNIYRSEYNSDGLITLVKDGKSAFKTEKKISSPESAVQIFNDVFRLDFATEEMFCMFAVNTKGTVVAAFVVALGDLSSTVIHPREIYKRALLSNAAAIVFAHNHPSGDPTPSVDDKDTTNKLVEAGRFLGIAVWDHVIIAQGRFMSFKEEALI